MITVVLGLQWGDEGKGKIVDALSPDFDLVARFQGGPNAGHTLVFNGEKHVLHTIPSGIFGESKQNLIGHGVVLDPITFAREVQKLDQTGLDFDSRLFLAQKVHLILPTHRLLDAASEASKGRQKIGSTLKGIGPAYMDKTGRNGLRIGDVQLPGFKQRYEELRDKHLQLLKLYEVQVDFRLEEEEAKWFDSLEVLQRFQTVDSVYFLKEKLHQGKSILAEGAQGAMLDIDFGTYPFVTSSNTATAGVCTGLGVPPQTIKQVIGISKAYCTRVGGGPFPTELEDETGERLRRAGGEFGATTGRPRRCGWIDLPALQYAVNFSGTTQLTLTKIDVLNDFEEIKVATAYRYQGKMTEHLPFDLSAIPVEPVYESFPGWKQSLDGCEAFEDLPADCCRFIRFVEEKLAVPVRLISTGADRTKLIRR